MSVDVHESTSDSPAQLTDLQPSIERAPLASRLWTLLWPKLIAIGIVLAVWQITFWSSWKPPWVFPSPATVFGVLGDKLGEPAFWSEVGTTMQRAAVGFAAALLIGTVLGIAVSRWRVLRVGVGSLITGLQTMPSIAWFPLAILLFGLTEQAILFVVILGAAPSIANGIISGIDYVPPQLVRAGTMLGATGINRYRYVVLPAALPSYVAGLKQGWAFAWRSLMAGELLVVIATRPSLGADLQFSREFSDAAGMLAVMIVILVIGMIMDALFSAGSEHMRRRRGLAQQ